MRLPCTVVSATLEFSQSIASSLPLAAYCYSHHPMREVPQTLSNYSQINVEKRLRDEVVQLILRSTNAVGGSRVRGETVLRW